MYIKCGLRHLLLGKVAVLYMGGVGLRMIAKNTPMYCFFR